MKVTRKTVWVSRWEIRYRQVCTIAILAIATAVAIAATLRGIWWAWYIVLLLIIMSAAVEYHLSIRVYWHRKSRNGRDQ